MENRHRQQHPNSELVNIAGCTLWPTVASSVVSAEFPLWVVRSNKHCSLLFVMSPVLHGRVHTKGDIPTVAGVLLEGHGIKLRYLLDTQ
uniref:Uncharacterized protein n=1 Tax=Rubinisphaera brasiliensis (strain ATCC 49424 / DSM 5305 / JCM 21570 / IAM 15109 / NBRC 103401 / IFAM 1448) TaxID=756272 RepID=F0SG30_RUBBR|nr:hypothetical protein Plabr_0692 [Rubinisphaera brasiliensis DSM 5305]